MPVLAGTGAGLAITGLALWKARQRRWLIFGWLWFVGTLVPVIGLTQAGEQAWADRFSYWPHIGLFVAIVWGLGELVERCNVPTWIVGAIGAFILGSLGVLTWVQVGYWHDTATLWERCVAVTRQNDVAHVHLGYHYLNHDRFELAEEHFAQAVRIHPDSADYRYFFGAVLLARGKLDEAAEQFQQSLQRAPHHADAWFNLGMVRLRQEKAEQASDCFRQALNSHPDSADALTALGMALERQGKPFEAIKAYAAALRLDPRQSEAGRGLIRLKNHK
jgi:Tfp pilus assembly protein PilF